MSSYSPGDRGYRGAPSYNAPVRHNDRDGRMYDDRHSRSCSRSRSPPHSIPRSRDHRYGSPGGPVSPPHDNSRTSPRGHAVDRRYHGGDGDISIARDYRSRERNEYRRPSRSPPRRRGRSSYRDRDREGYRSPGYDSRSRSYSRSRSRSRSRSQRGTRRPYYGQESREIMMEGLPVDMNEDDILNELTQYYHVEALEDVRVIRDRQTKISRKLGFIRFHTIDDSREFLERNFPSIYLYGNSGSHTDDRGMRVRIAYSREREDRNRIKAEGEWTCKICAIVNYAKRQKCFRCQAVRTDFVQLPPGVANPPRVANHGDNDVATDGTPSQFVLLRGLEASVTEELLAKGVAKLYKPLSGSEGQGAPPAAKKGAKVASTTGDSNLGAREGSIRRVLLIRDRRSNESWKYGFAEFATVADAQAALTRYNSFETFTISSKPVLASYIHAGVFVPVINPTASTERFTFSPLGNPSMKLAYWDENAYATELMVSIEDPDKKCSKPRVTASSTTDKHPKAGKETEKPKKRKADAGATPGMKKLAVPTHLQFWSNRHAELHGIQRDESTDKSSGGDNQQGSKEKGGSSSTSPVPTQSYADLNRKCCYLCMRQFKTEAEVNKHERLSQLHRDNLQNEALKAKAMAKLAKKRDDPQQPSTEYRDRAKERRQAFGPSVKSKEKKFEKEIEEAPAVSAMSKGAALLGKMGWSAGSGLGAEGSGMTAPIATDLYVQGVGLGAQGGKVGDAVQEAGRNTRGRYDDFLEKTKETARERYERMSKEG
ncbi:rna-binding protein [Paracoccidioides lutzii Pb01]|uniref:Rna-binding protein n=1 Tax=Paracoccidioides lutzii (strain ATCC MYA-826 / Pb01) TaxID=502779 RepID=C1H7D2_PARBA|nr:rna-binding protein [Paracoccidioides lutzii Pb01]EEH35626.2 rna-binding protein [Paracoccidioides lutzii Pb01]